MTVIEGNKIIAEFMGYRVFHKRYPRNHGIGAPEAEWKDMIVEKAKYHSSWDWLMPVVEKIHILREVKEVSIRPGRTRIWLKDGGFIQSPCKPENNSITECWLAVTKFIIQLNSNQ